MVSIARTYSLCLGWVWLVKHSVTSESARQGRVSGRSFARSSKTHKMMMRVMDVQRDWTVAGSITATTTATKARIDYKGFPAIVFFRVL